MDENEPIEFVTMGMFIIDEIHYQDKSKPPKLDIIGGAGSYSALGARLFSPKRSFSKRVGWIVDCGSDFPQELREFIAQWDTGVLMRETPERLTTRGWNEYGENEYRAFRYMTPKRRLTDEDLTPNFLLSSTFHLICSPTRCIDLVTSIKRRRTELSTRREVPPPLFIWEPVPDLCTPQEYGNCLKALKCVEVVSPNHTELGGFFGGSDKSVDRDFIEQCCDAWIREGIGSDQGGAVVVRAGKEGCYLAASENNSTMHTQLWIPAFHRNQEKVIDPTGGGNAFLGGLAIGLARKRELSISSSIPEAALMGSISASFAIEQVGMPILKQMWDGETWNGERVLDRLKTAREKLEVYLQP
ncbi:PfkB family carbohydrate kinase-like protein [Patellaria atrata CBS 101060]|uniref:PfkB family carbohydrate kinase-like protein n=1 Tax=Patellaria atrata CBS 101060 TaxID=1346257 RepID=A0A9P4SIV3_9PEZI|nr:PfkB family carbohydrate kinase-like protein [Patellaria atrata CBS 101060]